MLTSVYVATRWPERKDDLKLVGKTKAQIHNHMRHFGDSAVTVIKLAKCCNRHFHCFRKSERKTSYTEVKVYSFRAHV